MTSTRFNIVIFSAGNPTAPRGSPATRRSKLQSSNSSRSVSTRRSISCCRREAITRIIAARSAPAWPRRRKRRRISRWTSRRSSTTPRPHESGGKGRRRPGKALGATVNGRPRAKASAPRQSRRVGKCREGAMYRRRCFCALFAPQAREADRLLCGIEFSTRQPDSATVRRGWRQVPCRETVGFRALRPRIDTLLCDGLRTCRCGPALFRLVSKVQSSNPRRDLTSSRDEEVRPSKRYSS